MTDTPENIPENFETSLDNAPNADFDPFAEMSNEIVTEDQIEAAKIKDTKTEPEVELPPQNIGEIDSPFREGKKEGHASVPLPSDTYKAVESMISDLPAVDVTDDDEWTANLRNSYENEIWRGTGYRRFSQEGGQFTNMLKTKQGLNMTGSYAAQRMSNQVMTGERALLSVMNYMGVGNIYLAPLWNSGFWVSVKPPTESDLIDLMHLLRSEKVRTGRATHGLAYSSTTGVTARYVIDFFKAHIYNTSINSKDVDINQIEKYINVNDLEGLLLSMICAMYPNGFNYSRSCVANPVECNETVEATLDPSKLLYVNRGVLTEQMLGHMSNRATGTMQLKDVISYQSQLAARNIRVLNYEAGPDRHMRFEIKTPTLDKYLATTDSWISDIETTADRVLNKDATDNERAILINRHSKATTMRQYTHYVDSITYGDNVNIKDRKSIEQVLNTLSADSELTTAFNQAVTDLINDSTVASVAIPTYDCPACKKPVRSRQNMPDDYKNLIPLDILSIFFDLVRVKMDLINRR